MSLNGSVEYINGVPVATSFAIVGGSGATYPSIDSAIAGETETVVTGTTAAGTTNGVIIGAAGFSAVDDFYNGMFVVLTAAAPASGKTALWARIIDYVGATRTFTLDTSDAYGIGVTISVIDPVRITINKDLEEDATINKNAILNFGGCELLGQINVTAGNFVWMNDGKISNGIEDSRSIVGVIRLERMTISARTATIYAFKKTNAVDVGAVELLNSEFRGAVAGTQGFARWIIKDCINNGIADGDLNVPYRIVELESIAITFSNVSVIIDSQFSGAIFAVFGTGALTSSAGTKFLDIRAKLKPAGSTPLVQTFAPRTFSLIMGEGASTSTLTITSGHTIISGNTSDDDVVTGSTRWVYNVSIAKARALTGSIALSIGPSSSSVSLDFSAFDSNIFYTSSIVSVDGASTTTGTVSVSGASPIYANLGISKFAIVHVFSTLTSTASITVSSAILVNGGHQLSTMYFLVAQSSGTPTITVSSTLTINGCKTLAIFEVVGVAISVGTYAVSSTITGTSIGSYNCNIPVSVTGGTWTNSGDVSLGLSGDGSQILDLCTHAGSGGTLTVAGTFNGSGGIQSAYRHCRAGVSGGSATKSGDTYLTGIEFINGATAVLSVAGATAVGSGEIHLRTCQFRQANSSDCVIVTAGGNSTGPDVVAMDYCLFELELITSDGAGTLTWTGATWSMSHCSVFGLFVIVGDPFSSMLFWFTTFHGAVANYSISFSGTRPASYKFYKCNYRQRIDAGLPDIFDDYFTCVDNDSAAKTAGQLVKIDTTPELADPTNTDVVDGVLPEAAAATDDPVAVMTRGFTSVLVDNGTTINIGDNLILDNANPTKVVSGTAVVGQQIGRALTAFAAGGADGTVYARVDLR